MVVLQFGRIVSSASGHPEEQSDEGSALRTEKQILSGVYPERNQKQILRSAQNDREWSQDDRKL